ncbi:MAG: type II toxin-antitoxin system mRNA interferase toxin, RelE/StbE family [Chromatiales bacterium]|jgi:addiction module RelE/StbE family toxin|nr:type II toxin-antitoxin system mRNA interferase toxin, RelE/StbE family [Chromatiales bacterium]MDP6151455.1 type II toxin-antitoxin system mRNA interferase toxin, RelE/StbE family [Gammaproteobacteria bacterium]MDP7271872.1 type II toxin-antitoxin system mRNA interferase toxin, RelE/StbE family [Gammaproteobacteria bacterium]HJP04577.1 type II toxin-antitoxin system mRNA interferase toxin, RelE/StbE family [Gammaproteobacteria bacterium]
MWQVLEHRRVVRRIPKIPGDILKRYEKWKDIVVISGPPGLRQIKGFRDEALRGEWKGHRSSRLGGQHRVIYRVEEQNVVVKVIDLTAHDYRRKSQ